MPETVATYIATATLTAGSTLTFNAILAYTYAATAVAYVGYGVHQRRKAESRARAAYNASLQDRNVTLRGTLQARQIVLGKARTGGVLVFAGSTGDDKEKLTLVLALASHRIAGVDAVYFNDEEVPLDGSGYVTGGTYSKTTTEATTDTISITSGSGSVALPYTPTSTVTVAYTPGGDDTTDIRADSVSVVGNTVSVTGMGGGTFTGTAVVSYQHTLVESKARVRWMLGTDDQAAFADLITQFPAEWTSAHTLSGIAYLVAELDYDPDVYPAGIPNISAVVRGADEVYDPRTLTTGYSENPALLLRHYLLHPLGGRRTVAQLDGASLIEAANVCDTSVNYGAGATALYTAGTVANTEQTPGSVCDELAEAMAGRWGYSGGVIRVRAGSVGAAVAAIDADWLAEGSLTVQPRRPRAELGNVMQGSFVDPASNWQLVPFPRVPEGAELAAMVAEDGGMELPQEIEFGAVTRVGQAQQVAATLLREARQALTVTMDCNLRAYSLQIFDTVTLTLERYGWDAKLFEVVQRSFTLGGAIRLTLRETGSAIYAFGTSFGTTDALPNTSLPNPWVVPTVGALVATSGASVLPDGSIVARVVLTWPAVADRGVTQGGYIELAYREAGDAAATFQTVRADSFTGHTIVGLRGGRAYVFQARAVNGLGVRGRYSAQTAHTVWRARAPAIYRQDATPTDDVRDGDVWFDTDAGNAQYLRFSGAWVSVRDAGIAAALSAANDAQATADGKIATYWQTTAPGSASEGDIWFDTDAGFKQYRYTSGVWTAADDTRIGQAISDASDAQATADGKVTTFVAASAPTADAVGDLWLDTDDGNKLYRWSGSAWVALALGTGAIASNAATEVYVTTPSSAVTVTGIFTTPDSFASVRNTVIATVTFTPTASGTAQLFFDGRGQYVNASGSVADARWSIQDDGGTFDVWKRVDVGIAIGATISFPVQTSRRFNVTGGVAYSFSLYASKLNTGDTFTVDQMEMRAEVIKR